MKTQGKKNQISQLQKMILPENRSSAVKMMVRQFKKEKENSLHDLNNFSMHVHVLSLFQSLDFGHCLRS